MQPSSQNNSFGNRGGKPTRAPRAVAVASSNASHFADAINPSQPLTDIATMIFAARLGLVSAFCLLANDTLAMIAIIARPERAQSVVHESASMVLGLLMLYIAVEAVVAWRLWARQSTWAAAILMLLCLLQTLGHIGGDPVLFGFAFFMLYFAAVSLRGARALGKARRPSH